MSDSPVESGTDQSVTATTSAEQTGEGAAVAQVSDNNAESAEDPTITLEELQKMVDEDEDLVTAIFAGSDERNCSYPQGYVKRQALFACRDCSNKTSLASSSTSATREPAGVCLACAIACHADHDLVELYTKRNFRCDCGNSKLTEVPCRLFPEKEVDNPLNNYNHNFSGLYCVCNKPYPCDPNDSEVEKIQDDEMVQCIVCEDWFHACHLNIPAEDIPLLEKDDEEYELVCPSCSETHVFLANYYLYFRKRTGKIYQIDKTNDSDTNTCFLKTVESDVGKIEEASSSSNSSSVPPKVLLFPPNWRASICKCNSCEEMYSHKNIAFIGDLSDTLAAYEAAGRARTDAGGMCVSDRLVTAKLAGIRDRVVRTEVIHGYTELKSQLGSFLKDVCSRKHVLTEEDVTGFFDKLSRKRKRVDDEPGDSLESSGGSSRSPGRDDDDNGSSGLGTPPASCHGNW